MMDPATIQATTSGSWFEAKLTLDGLLTFVGGLLAFFAILYQVRHSDRGLQGQLDEEKRRYAEAAKAENLALARALLMEIDHFYMGYVWTLHVIFRGLQPGQLTPLRSMPSDPFTIYRSCGAQIGRLPSGVVANVVRAYAGAQWLIDRVTDYREAYFMVKDKGFVNQSAKFARTLLAEQSEVVKGAEATLFRTAEMLCEYVGAQFAAPEFALAELKPDANQVR